MFQSEVDKELEKCLVTYNFLLDMAEGPALDTDRICNFNTTSDLIEYLSIVAGVRAEVICRGLCDGVFTSYLRTLSDDRFTAEAWSRALSRAFHKRLRFGAVREAKDWLITQEPDYLKRGLEASRAP